MCLIYRYDIHYSKVVFCFISELFFEDVCKDENIHIQIQNHSVLFGEAEFWCTAFGGRKYFLTALVPIICDILLSVTILYCYYLPDTFLGCM